MAGGASAPSGGGRAGALATVIGRARLRRARARRRARVREAAGGVEAARQAARRPTLNPPLGTQQFIMLIPLPLPHFDLW